MGAYCTNNASASRHCSITSLAVLQFNRTSDASINWSSALSREMSGNETSVIITFQLISFLPQYKLVAKYMSVTLTYTSANLIQFNAYASLLASMYAILK